MGSIERFQAEELSWGRDSQPVKKVRCARFESGYQAVDSRTKEVNNRKSLLQLLKDRKDPKVICCREYFMQQNHKVGSYQYGSHYNQSIGLQE